MPEFLFYHQQRVDHGLRTGLEIDAQTVMEDFIPGDQDEDPALLWYFDVRGRGADLPSDAEAVRDWLLERESDFGAVLRSASEQLRAGVDHDGWPFRISFPDVLPGLELIVTGSAIRRIDAVAMSRLLAGAADRWSALLHSLNPEAAAV